MTAMSPSVAERRQAAIDAAALALLVARDEIEERPWAYPEPEGSAA